MKKYIVLIIFGFMVQLATTVHADSPVSLWSGKEYPTQDKMETIKGIEFIKVKTRQPEIDSWTWQHGPAIVRYKGDFYASVGVNPGSENTVGEKIIMIKSQGDWRHWEEPVVLEPNDSECGRSHGVFLVAEDKLWAFHSKFFSHDKAEGKSFPGLVMEAFQLDETTGTWKNMGNVANDIWPYRTPVRLPNGNYITAGMDKDWINGTVAISNGSDLLHWKTQKVNAPGKCFSEGTLWFDDNDDKITVLLRNDHQPGREYLRAAVTQSSDYGETWTCSTDSDLAMNGCKPDAGTLSTGQRYLVGYTAAGNHNRSSLTIAVGRPGETTLCKVWKIRNIADPTPDNAFDAISFAYPSSVEYDGNLFVIYSVGDPKGNGYNRNHVELAVIPISALTIN
ncbi:MAG: sialidase family protein [Planctomycetia bacterium]|nr:sialidase family protein [Planctomycetia bacterium]